MVEILRVPRRSGKFLFRPSPFRRRRWLEWGLAGADRGKCRGFAETRIGLRATARSVHRAGSSIARSGSPASGRVSSTSSPDRSDAPRCLGRLPPRLPPDATLSDKTPKPPAVAPTSTTHCRCFREITKFRRAPGCFQGPPLRAIRPMPGFVGGSPMRCSDRPIRFAPLRSAGGI